MDIAQKIIEKKTSLGIELGSTRIKAVLIDDTYTPIAGGSHRWENRLENGIWTYSLDEIHNGIRACYADLKREVKEKYGVTLTGFGSMGVSAMMHGYMPFDEEGRLLVPFRTWRNTVTEQAAEELTELFHFNIPQRWSISHLYQAVLNGESHIADIAYINTLAGYIHFMLTGRFEVGVGEASGMFPIENGGYNESFLKLIDEKLDEKGFARNVISLLPAVRKAGGWGAFLTDEGARFLDPDGDLEAGTAVCPPEGDAGTGMVATNSVTKKTGNISAGTSIFAMLVLEEPLKGCYPEIDIVTTPDGADVAMVHCNNCCGELDGWVNIFGEFAALAGIDMDKSALYEALYKNALNSPADCGGVVAYNCISGEPVLGVESGRPMYFRRPDGQFSLASFFRAQLYSAVAAVNIGLDILFDKENAAAEKFTGHGGLFKVGGVAQQLLADGINTPVAVMKTAGEGGAWGMALLAAYMKDGEGKSLPQFLESEVFADMESSTLAPNAEGKAGFDKFIENYKAGLAAEKAAAL